MSIYPVPNFKNFKPFKYVYKPPGYKIAAKKIKAKDSAGVLDIRNTGLFK